MAREVQELQEVYTEQSERGNKGKGRADTAPDAEGKKQDVAVVAKKEAKALTGDDTGTGAVAGAGAAAGAEEDEAEEDADDSVYTAQGDQQADAGGAAPARAEAAAAGEAEALAPIAEPLKEQKGSGLNKSKKQRKDNTAEDFARSAISLAMNGDEKMASEVLADAINAGLDKTLAMEIIEAFHL